MATAAWDVDFTPHLKDIELPNGYLFHPLPDDPVVSAS